jgi:hypothetical protein
MSRPGRIQAGLLLLSLICVEALANPPAAASLCDAGQTTYFSCHTARHRMLSLCGALPSALQYRYGTPGKIELSYPDNAAQGAKQFAFAHYSRYRTERVEISFSHAGADYTLFDYTESGKRSAGVQVATAAGKSAEIGCAAEIRGMLAPMAKSLRCDTDSALNGGQCR